MKNKTSLIITIFLVSITAASGTLYIAWNYSNPLSLPPPSVGETQLYFDSRYSFSIAAPEGWIINRNSEGDTFFHDKTLNMVIPVIMNTPKDHEMSSNYHVKIDEPIIVDSFPQYLKLYKQRIAEQYSDGKVTYISGNYRTISSLQAYDIMYTTDTDDSCYVREVIMLHHRAYAARQPSSARAYIIHFDTCTEEIFNKYQNHLERIVLSFKLIE